MNKFELPRVSSEGKPALDEQYRKVRISFVPELMSTL